MRTVSELNNGLIIDIFLFTSLRIIFHGKQVTSYFSKGNFISNAMPLRQLNQKFVLQCYQ